MAHGCATAPALLAVTAALRDPVPGWVDNVCGITGIMMEIGRGTIRSIICEEDYIVDLIPVDLVVNTLITAAWRTGTHHANNVQVRDRQQVSFSLLIENVSPSLHF